MIIINQDKDEIINVDNIMSISITDCDEEGFGIFAAFMVGIDDIYKLLGYYKTKERAKEVLQALTNKYKATEVFKTAVNRVNDSVGALAIKESFIFEMPID